MESLMTFLSTLVVHGVARVFSMKRRPSKGQFSLDMGRVFQGMFLIVGIGILLGFVVGVYCVWPGGRIRG